MIGLPVQASRGDKAGVIIAAGLQQDEVTGEGLVLKYLNNVTDLQTKVLQTPRWWSGALSNAQAHFPIKVKPRLQCLGVAYERSSQTRPSVKLGLRCINSSEGSKQLSWFRSRAHAQRVVCSNPVAGKAVMLLLGTWKRPLALTPVRGI